MQPYNIQLLSVINTCSDFTVSNHDHRTVFSFHIVGLCYGLFHGSCEKGSENSSKVCVLVVQCKRYVFLTVMTLCGKSVHWFMQKPQTVNFVSNLFYWSSEQYSLTRCMWHSVPDRSCRSIWSNKSNLKEKERGKKKKSSENRSIFVAGCASGTHGLETISSARKTSHKHNNKDPIRLP